MSVRAWGLIVAAGAVLRFVTLDSQSLWYDEAVTAQLLQMDFGAMLRAIPDSESTPPLYYVLAWLWTHVFGWELRLLVDDDLQRSQVCRT